MMLGAPPRARAGVIFENSTTPTISSKAAASLVWLFMAHPLHIRRVMVCRFFGATAGPFHAGPGRTIHTNAISRLSPSVQPATRMRPIIVRRQRHAAPDRQAKRHDKDQERYSYRFGGKDNGGGRQTLCLMRPANQSGSHIHHTASCFARSRA